MNKYRDRLEIVMDMLSVIHDGEGAKKTRIMYMANLSWENLVRYLTDLQESGLIRYADSDCFVLTTKGKRFLAKCTHYRRRSETTKEQLNHIEDERTALEKVVFNVRTTHP